MNGTFAIPASDGTPLQARIDGTGDDWIVLSNSVLTDLRIWDGQIAALSERYRILRYDQRGHGGSGVPEQAMDFEDYGADVLALLDGVGVERCSFVGLSMGVPSGLAALGRAPERFTRFVAVDGMAKSSGARAAFWQERRETALAEGLERIAAETAARWLPGEAVDGERMATLIAMISATPPQGFAAATHALEGYDHAAALSQMALPFLAIAGEQDGTMPEAMKRQFSPLPQAQFATIAGAGHVPNFQRPEAFNAALLRFLDASK